MALDFGLVSFDSSAAERAGVGVGPIFQVRFGAEFWDQLLAGVSLGTYSLHDKRPFSQTVINCQEVSNVCGDPSPAKSSVATGFVTAELGYQTRFRPSSSFSLSPGAALGYLQSLTTLKRSIDCVDCTSEALHLDASGGYVAPFFRVTFDRGGWIAVIVRSQWFFNTDIAQMTTVGGELFLP